MRNYRHTILALLCTVSLLPMNLFGQGKFEEARLQYQGMLERPGSDGKQKISKQFRRWEWFWQGRLQEDGTFPTPAMYLHELRKVSQQKGVEDAQSVKTWKELGPIAPDMPSAMASWNGIGRVNCIDFARRDQNLMFAGSAAGGIWKTTNSGQQWQPINIPNIPVIGISDLVIAPSDDNIIYAATGDVNGSIAGQLSRYNGFTYGIIKSTDGGNTWSLTGLSSDPAENDLIGRLWVDPANPNIVVAASYGGIYRTTNGGTSWTRTASGIFREVIQNPVSTVTLYAATYAMNGGASIHRSTDAGVTWSMMYTIPEANRIRLAVTKANQNVVVALASNFQTQGFEGLYKSTDAGTSFSELRTSLNLLGWSASGNDRGGQGFYDLACEVSPTNANHIYVGGVNIWRTTTNGSTWELSAHWTGDRGAPYVHADQHFFKFHPSRTHLFATHDGGIARSTDGGVTWRDVSRGMAIQQYYGLAVSNSNPALTIAGAQDNGTALSKNSGASFVHTLDGDGMLGGIDAVNPSIMYGSQYYGNFWRTSNGGSSWSFISSENLRAESGSWVAPIAVDPRLSNTVYVGYRQIWKSTTAGATWDRISNIPTGSSMRVIAVAPSNPNYIYVAYNTTLHFTSNGGQSWQQQPGITGFIMGVDVDPTRPDRIYVAIGGFSAGQKVLMVDKGGVSNLTGTGLPNLPCNSVVYQKGTASNRIFAGTDIGVFVMDEGTNFWQSYGRGLPPVIVTGMRLLPSSNALRISTYGRGIWEIDVAQCAATRPTITAVTKTTICAGDSVVLEANAGYAAYRWSNGDTTRRIVLNNSTQTGVYQVGVEDSKGCRAISSSLTVTINKLPSKPLVTKIARDTLRSSAFGGVSKFQWFKDDVAIAGATSRNLPVTQSGTYRVMVSDASCSNTSDGFNFTYEPATSVDEQESPFAGFSVVPNPIEDVLTLRLKGIQGAMITIVDINGRLVFTTQQDRLVDELRVDASTWSAGMYIVQVRSSGAVWTSSIAKR
ncbi:MAG: VPS10 domain-containing protein [Bacteroidota bacterium]|jgi:photosystem II stability/assembly factor-like uncharacterized protein